jgi:hypothetical protein
MYTTSICTAPKERPGQGIPFAGSHGCRTDAHTSLSLSLLSVSLNSGIGILICGLFCILLLSCHVTPCPALPCRRLFRGLVGSLGPEYLKLVPSHPIASSRATAYRINLHPQTQYAVRRHVFRLLFPLWPVLGSGVGTTVRLRAAEESNRQTDRQMEVKPALPVTSLHATVFLS